MTATTKQGGTLLTGLDTKWHWPWTNRVTSLTYVSYRANYPIDLTNVATLPQIVSDWVETKRGDRRCLSTQSSADINWDPLHSVNEMALSELVIIRRCTKSPVLHIQASRRSFNVTISYINNFDGKYSKEKILDARDPSFFRKLGNYVRCRCPKAP